MKVPKFLWVVGGSIGLLLMGWTTHVWWSGRLSVGRTGSERHMILRTEDPSSFIIGATTVTIVTVVYLLVYVWALRNFGRILNEVVENSRR